MITLETVGKPVSLLRLMRDMEECERVLSEHSENPDRDAMIEQILLWRIHLASAIDRLTGGGSL